MRIGSPKRKELLVVLALLGAASQVALSQAVIANSPAVMSQSYIIQPGYTASGPHCFEIATLPPNNNGDDDHLHIVANLNLGWAAAANASIDALFGNRNGFTYSYTARGVPVSSTAKLVAYMNADTSVNIYLMFSNVFATASYTVLETTDETVYSNPADLLGATPAGTLVFDSSNSSYPPSMFAGFNGNVGIGTTAPNSTFDLTASGNGIFTTNSTNNAGVYITGQFGPYGALQAVNAANAAAINLVLQPFGGNIGIGTTTPQTALHVLVGNSPPTASGNMAAGAIFSAANGYASLNMGAFDNGNTSRYSWIQSAFSNNSGIPSSLALQQNGGNVGIGTTSPGAKLEIDGNVKLTSGSGASITFQDGSIQTVAYTGVTCGGDYAESVDVTGNRTNYEPGDVLVLDVDNPGKMLKSIEAYSTSVSGIYSTKPGTVGRRQTTAKSPDEVPMAVVGIVPAKVSTENGPIKVGDLLVTSSTPGYAMKGTDRSRMLGAVVGKAMAKLDSGTGVIEVLVTLQ